MRLIREYGEIDDSESTTSGSSSELERDESEALTDDSVSTYRGWTGYFEDREAAPSPSCEPTNRFYSQLSYRITRQGKLDL
jgi:uncharacterized membrane-anchored protein